jgi:hypothetical protein
MNGVNAMSSSFAMKENSQNSLISSDSAATTNDLAPDFDKSVMSGRIYASSAPKIFLETLTARTSLIIIVLTYVIFIIGFVLDIQTTYQSFNASNYQLGALSCTSISSSASVSSETTSCSQNGEWNATVTDLTNVLSIELNVKQYNLSSIVNSPTTNNSFSVIFNLKIWACYEGEGCGNAFKSDDSYTSDPSVWQKVVFLDNQQLDIDLNKDLLYDNGSPYLTEGLLSNTFQNQEALPTNGLVKSYFLFVEYLYDPYDLFSGLTTASQNELTYTFDVVTRPKQPISDSCTIVLLFFTLILVGFYSYILAIQEKVLSEQFWLIGYLCLLILFQNPVYCIIVWIPTVSSSAVYISFVIQALAQCGLFILWLLFADPAQRKIKKIIFYYGPKIFIGFIIFLINIILLTYQFPGLQAGPNSSKRDALLAVVNWTTSLQTQFITFTLLFLFFFWLWMFIWSIRLYVTYSTLKKLPYMSTRYIQLSFRFFSLQATLVTIYYIFQYAFVIYWISLGATSNNNSGSVTSITDNINTLFRQQVQLFGKTLFLTVYGFILCFLFLPSNLLNQYSSGLQAAFAATYVITEEEHQKLVKYRKKLLKSSILLPSVVVNKLINVKIDIFCVDLALKLREVSFQAYYDLPEKKTVSGYPNADVNLASAGVELVDFFYDTAHEVICYIVRERKGPTDSSKSDVQSNEDQRIVVAFRGTASKRQMEDNLNYRKKQVDFYRLEPLYAVDMMDGLNIKETGNLLLFSFLLGFPSYR